MEVGGIIPGGPMVKAPLIPLQGAQVLSQVKEFKIPWPGGKKKKRHICSRITAWKKELPADLEYPIGSHKSRE